MRRAFSRFIRRYRMHWFVVTIVLYAAAIPVAVWVYPASTLTLTILVSVSGLTSSMAAFADLLTDEDDDELEPLPGGVDSDPTSRPSIWEHTLSEQPINPPAQPATTTETTTTTQTPDTGDDSPDSGDSSGE